MLAIGAANLAAIHADGGIGHNITRFTGWTDQ
jgi:hypothetical protein